MSRETIHVRGEGGIIWEMDLPLRPDHEARLKAGLMQRVNPDGTPWTFAASAAEEPVPDGEDQDDGGEDQPPELEAFLAEPPEPVKATRPAKATGRRAEN